MKKLTPLIITLIVAFIFLTFVFVGINLDSEKSSQVTFDAQRAYQDVLIQVELGPRTPGSEAHEQAIQYIQSELLKADWIVDLQQIDYQSHEVKNIIAYRGSGKPLIILGAH